MISREIAIGIGVNKGGTTSLWYCLGQHPQIVAAREKELDFFGLWERWSRGVEWYQSQWPVEVWHDSRLMPLEFTPHYLDNPLAPFRIRAIFPLAKLIVLLRDPVDRAISHYWDMRRNGWESLPIEEAFDREWERLGKMLRRYERLGTDGVVVTAHGYRYRGLYWQKLKRYFAAFPRDQIWIGRSEDFFADPQAVCEQIFRFLGLEPVRVRPVVANRGKKGEVPGELVQGLRRYFRPHNRRLYQMLGRNMGWQE